MDVGFDGLVRGHDRLPRQRHALGDISHGEKREKKLARVWRAQGNWEVDSPRNYAIGDIQPSGEPLLRRGLCGDKSAYFPTRRCHILDTATHLGMVLQISSRLGAPIKIFGCGD